jgi:hypothetical protein
MTEEVRWRKRANDLRGEGAQLSSQLEVSNSGPSVKPFPAVVGESRLRSGV